MIKIIVNQNQLHSESTEKHMIICYFGRVKYEEIYQSQTYEDK